MQSSQGCSPARYWLANATASGAIEPRSRNGTSGKELWRWVIEAGVMVSENIAEEEEAAQQQQEEDAGEHGKVALGKPLHRLAEAGDESGFEEESAAARDERGEREGHWVEARHAARDGDDLVGQGREATGRDDPNSPGVVEAAEL